MSFCLLFVVVRSLLLFVSHYDTHTRMAPHMCECVLCVVRAQITIFRVPYMPYIPYITQHIYTHNIKDVIENVDCGDGARHAVSTKGENAQRAVSPRP